MNLSFYQLDFFLSNSCFSVFLALRFHSMKLSVVLLSIAAQQTNPNTQWLGARTISWYLTIGGGSDIWAGLDWVILPLHVTSAEVTG